MPGNDDTPAERLAAHFYAWERRGRGWQVWPYPVDIEPPFRPFLIHFAPAPQLEDDGRIPTLGSAVADFFRGKSRRDKRLPAAAEWTEAEPDVAPADDSEALVTYGITLPPELKIARDAAEQLLASLLYARHAIGFEVVGTAAATRLQIVTRESDAGHTVAALRNQFPEAVILPGADLLLDVANGPRRQEPFVVDFGLSEEFMLPLRRVKSFDPDPLIALAAAMENLDEHEVGVFQVLFRAVRHPWGESMLRAVSDDEGKAFFANAPQMVGQAREKAGRPLFAAIVRIAAVGPDPPREAELARHIASVVSHAKEPLSNELIPLANDGYPDADHWRDFLARESRRAGMLLNLDELLTFAHLPSSSVRSPKFARIAKRTNAAPTIAIGEGVVIGENAHAGTANRVVIPTAERLRHTYLIGASGTGKSTLMLRMIQQDIEAGRGIAVLDPHGDLVDQVVGLVPESRLQDVVFFDPSDEERPIAWNILQAHSALEKTLLSSDLVATFRRLSTSWGDQMTSVLSNAVLAFLESTEGGSIADLRRFLVDAEWRKTFLATVTDPEIVFYWQREFPLLAGRPQASILTRLDTFLRPKIVRAMVAVPKDRLDFRGAIDNGRIFLAKLAQGAIGEENAWLLGSLLVSKFHQVALSRQDVDAQHRREFFLYLDEFHHFITPSLASILSGARKYGLGLVLAHQDMRQLASRDADVAAAVIANPSTRISFRVGEADAKRLEESFTHFTAKDLQNLGVGDAIARIERSDWDFNLRTLPMPAVAPDTAAERRARAIEHSRRAYGREAPVAEPTREAHTEVIEPPAPLASPAPKRAVATRTNRAPVTPPLPPPVESAPLPGRGGAQHVYLQTLVKRIAEHKGFRVTIEQQVLGGAGSVDVALEGHGRKIACEISVTSTPAYETGNVRKCLAAGFDEVLVIAADAKSLRRLERTLLRDLEPAERARLHVLSADGLVEHLGALHAEGSAQEDHVHGYKVKVAFGTVGDAETKARRQALGDVVARAFKRLKKTE